jgi:hypothetical protein
LLAPPPDLFDEPEKNETLPMTLLLILYRELVEEVLRSSTEVLKSNSSKNSGSRSSTEVLKSNSSKKSSKVTRRRSPQKFDGSPQK